MSKLRWSSVLRPRNSMSTAQSSTLDNSATNENVQQITKKPKSENTIQAEPKPKCRVTAWKRKERKTNEDLYCGESDEDFPTFMVQTKKLSAKKQKTKLKKVKPSWEQFLQEVKELEEYKIKVAKARALVAEDEREQTSTHTFLVKKQSIEPVLPKLDCKHLTLEEITQYFKKNTTFLTDIMSGKHFSKRHNEFKQKHLQKCQFHLTASLSMIVFSFEQIHKMANLMSEQFDPDNQNKDEYFFKVLIPELCLKIFMDTHKMSEEEAVNYLQNRPCD